MCLLVWLCYIRSTVSIVLGRRGMLLAGVYLIAEPCFGRAAQVTKLALKPLDMQQTKDIETAIAGARADKLKEKTAADAAKKGDIPYPSVS